MTRPARRPRIAVALEVSMSRVVAASVVLLAALGGSAEARSHRKHRSSGDDMAELPSVMALRTSPVSPRRGVTLYLNKDGGTLTAGWDDAANGVSSVAMNASGGVVEVPAWEGSTRAWNQVVACAQDRFAPFDVDLVTRRPTSGDYMMIMVGGLPSMFGYPTSVSGVAPYSGEVVRGAVGFVFSENIGEDVDSTCVSLIHEAGHVLGLDHVYLCEDPMSYLWGCGEKRFRDVDAPCGESEERLCGNGESTQNSYRILAANVGLRGADDEPEPEPERDDEDDVPYDDGSGWGTSDDDGSGWGGGYDHDDRDQEEQDATDDGVGPVVTIDGDADGDTVVGNQWISIVVRAHDPGGVADVELGWASDDSQYVISCNEPPDDMPVACTRDGDVFTFQLYVGTGLRAMAARATDGLGYQTVSDARVLYLEE